MKNKVIVIFISLIFFNMGLSAPNEYKNPDKENNHRYQKNHNLRTHSIRNIFSLKRSAGSGNKKSSGCSFQTEWLPIR